MDKKTIRNNSISIGTGIGTYYLTKHLGFRTVKTVLSPLRPKIPENRVEPLRQSINELIKNEQLDKINIRFVDTSNPQYIEACNKNNNKKLFSIKRKIVSTKNPIKKLKLLYVYSKQKRNTKIENELLEGTNGCYINFLKKIIVNMKKIPHAFFHEAGNAIDYTNPFLEKLFKYNKNKKLLRFPIFATLLTALVTPANKENKTITDKINSFVKKHCGILATLGFLPMMVCETSANLKGQFLAKKYAHADLKLLTKSHMHSLVSYWALPLIAGISVWTANKVKDKIAQNLKHSDPKTLKS